MGLGYSYDDERHVIIRFSFFTILSSQIFYIAIYKILNEYIEILFVTTKNDTFEILQLKMSKFTELFALILVKNQLVVNPFLRFCFEGVGLGYINIL